MTNFDEGMTLVERDTNLSKHSVTAEDLIRMRKRFDELPSKAHKMSEADRKVLQRLLPTVNIDQVSEAEVKSVAGTCECGRDLTLVDIVAAALKDSKHSVHFLEKIFNGTDGRYVVVGYRAPTVLSAEFRESMPVRTIYVKDAAPVPCKDCGAEHEIILFQKHILHFWVQ